MQRLNLDPKNPPPLPHVMSYPRSRPRKIKRDFPTDDRLVIWRNIQRYTKPDRWGVDGEIQTFYVKSDGNYDELMQQVNAEQLGLT